MPSTQGRTRRIHGRILWWLLCVCALTMLSGANAYAQISITGKYTTYAPYLPIVPLFYSIGVKGGGDHSLFLGTDATVWAWGDNEFGQLGNGTTFGSAMPAYATPARVHNLQNVSAIAAGYSHSLAVQGPAYDGGYVWAWGLNDYGQLGNGTTTNSPTPVKINGISNIADVECGGYHSLALTGGNTVWAWGLNASGQLGNGTTTNSSTPVKVSGLPAIIASIAAGSSHSLALDSGGNVWAWGFNNEGQLGNGTTTSSSTPARVVGPGGSGFLSGVIAIAAGAYHSLAITSGGAVWAWGENNDGQLGNGTTTNSSIPVQVVGQGGSGSLTGVIAIAAGTFHSLALDNSDNVWAWGSNANGQLGNTTTTETSTPVQVLGPGGFGVLGGNASISNISAGSDFSLAYDDEGEVWAWGDNADGELGNGTFTGFPNLGIATPVQVVGYGDSGYLTGIVAIAGGVAHSLALDSSGFAWAWGDNSYGELGNNTYTSSDVPGFVLYLP